MLGVIMIGLARSACTEAEDDPGGVVPAAEPITTTTTLTVPLPGTQSDQLTEYTRYTQVFGIPCNPLLEICLE